MSRLLYSHSLEDTSFLARLHPMTMLTVLGCLVVVVFSTLDFAVMGAVLLLLLAVIVAAGLPLRSILSVLLVVVPMAAFIVLLQGFARTTNIVWGAQLFGIGAYLSGDGLLLGAQVAVRIVVLAVATTTFFVAVSPVKLTRALYEARVPFKYAYQVTLALRFLPLVLDELTNINNAQKSRGYDIDRVNPLLRGFKVFPLMVPLIVLSLRRSSAIALAMDLRAFDARPERSFYVTLHHGPADTWIRMAAVAVAALFVVRAVLAAFGLISAG